MQKCSVTWRWVVWVLILQSWGSGHISINISYFPVSTHLREKHPVQMEFLGLFCLMIVIANKLIRYYYCTMLKRICKYVYTWQQWLVFNIFHQHTNIDITMCKKWIDSHSHIKLQCSLLTHRQRHTPHTKVRLPICDVRSVASVAWKVFTHFSEQND